MEAGRESRVRGEVAAYSDGRTRQFAAKWRNRTAQAQRYAPRMQMLDGFNEGWIEFEGGEAGSLKGEVSFETVLQGLMRKE